MATSVFYKMKKLVLLTLSLFFSFSSAVMAEESIRSIYERIEGLNKVVSYDSFEYSYNAYVNAPEHCQSKVLTINDFEKSRFYKRSAILDMQNKVLIKSLHVAHGWNTDDGKGNAEKFSNINGSNQSSLGIYCTAETYMGGNGYSLRLDGLSGELNSLARKRNIVVHGAKYVTDTYAGRSEGCPAYSREENEEVINLIKGGSILVVYSNQLKNQ